MRLFLLLLISIISINLWSQEDTSLVGNTLSVNQYMEWVRNNHPMAKQARLLQSEAEAQRIKASGNFDPKLFTDIDQKYFDDKTYYRLQDYGVQIPAWFGLSAKAGYEQNDGVFLNPQENVPSNGLWYADLSITLGRGLFIDERRAMLKQARLMVEAADFEVELALNQLYQEALNQYWKWYEAYATYNVYQEAVELARVRFDIVKENAMIGEEPFIDTLEATIQVQNRVLKLQEAQINLNNERQMLETYLWLDGQIPLELQEETRPLYPEGIDGQLLSKDWFQKHPLLQTYDLKIDQLEVQQRWNRERLKPQLDISYKFLNEPVNNDDFFAQYSPSNYNWGLGASFPLFLRKERADIQKTGIKIRDTEYSLQLKQREIQNKVSALQTELAVTQERLAESRRLVNNRQRLLEGEITKFENGESSLFLVNQRELPYIQSREKQIELEAKLKIVLAKLRATAGDLD